MTNNSIYLKGMRLKRSAYAGLQNTKEVGFRDKERTKGTNSQRQQRVATRGKDQRYGRPMFEGCCFRSDVRESHAVISGSGATSPLLSKLDLQREGRSGCWCYRV